MIALRSFRPAKTYERGKVICRKCAGPVYLYKVAALPAEFSVQCSRCGTRGVYTNREVTIESVPERRKKPRRDSERR